MTRSADPNDIAAIRARLTPAYVFRNFTLRDHGYVRAVLPNFHKVDEDLYRAAHPSPRLLLRAKELGVRSVLSLRGDAHNTPNDLERLAAHDLGLELRFLRMRTIYLPPQPTLLELIALLKEMPKPMLVHCKSGADRTGLAVTLYLHVLKSVPIATARAALSWRYAHLPFTRAGIVHRMLDAYTDDHAETGINFETWAETKYDQWALMDRDPPTSG